MLHALFQTDTWKSKKSKVFFGVFTTQILAAEAALRNKLYTKESNVLIEPCHLNCFTEEYDSSSITAYFVTAKKNVTDIYLNGFQVLNENDEHTPNSVYPYADKNYALDDMANNLGDIITDMEHDLGIDQLDHVIFTVDVTGITDFQGDPFSDWPSILNTRISNNRILNIEMLE